MIRLLAILLLALAACKEKVAEAPSPVPMTAGTLGHFCQMDLLEHPGPKAQVHLAGMPGAPLFFSQVRDAVAFQRMPEQGDVITAIYVSDMAKAPEWEDPGPANWIAAAAAFYVAGAAVPGGMGAPELVPFGTREAADRFAGDHGGTVLSLAEIPDELVLAPVEIATDADGDFVPPAPTPRSLP